MKQTMSRFVVLVALLAVLSACGTNGISSAVPTSQQAQPSVATQVPTASVDLEAVARATSNAEATQRYEADQTATAQQAISDYIQTNIAADLEMVNGQSVFIFDTSWPEPTVSVSEVGHLVLGPLLNGSYVLTIDEASNYTPSDNPELEMGIFNQDGDFIINELGYAFKFLGEPDLSLHNFIFGADVSWNWDGDPGVVSCAIALRADGDPSTSSHVRFITRSLDGLPVWGGQLWEGGHFEADVLGTGTMVNRVISGDQAAINHYVIAVSGDVAIAFANGERIGAFALRGLANGGIALMAVAHSVERDGTPQPIGESTCTFNNMWVWGLPDQVP